MINIRRVEDIYSKEFYTVDILDGVSKVRTVLLENVHSPLGNNIWHFRHES